MKKQQPHPRFRRMSLQAWNNVVGEEDTKRRKMDIKLESEDANFAFPESVQGEGKVATRNGIVSGRPASVNGSTNRVVGVTRPRPHMGVLAKRPPPAHQGPITLTSQLCKLALSLPSSYFTDEVHILLYYRHFIRNKIDELMLYVTHSYIVTLRIYSNTSNIF